MVFLLAYIYTGEGNFQEIRTGPLGFLVFFLWFACLWYKDQIVQVRKTFYL